MAGGFGPDRLQPPARGESVKKSVTKKRGVGHNPICVLQSPEAVKVLKGWKVAVRVYDTLQSALILSSGSSVPDGDGGGEDGLDTGSLEVHHHCLWQVELLQLPQEKHPLLSFFGSGI